MESKQVPVSEIAQTQVLTCSPDDTVHQVLRSMHQEKLSSIIVVEEQRPVGIWTEADALSVDLQDSGIYQRPIREFMSQPVLALPGDTPLNEVAARFKQQQVRHFILTDEQGGLSGIVTQTDVILRQSPEAFLYLIEVSSAIHGPPLCLSADLSLADTMRQLSSAKTDAAVIEPDAAGNWGIITERDVIRLLAKRITQPPIGDLAHRPLITIRHDASLLQAKNTLGRENIRHIGVLDDDERLIGLLSFSDILSNIQFEYLSQLRQALDERDRALKQARNNLHLAFSVLESTREGIMVVNTEGRIEMVNPAFCEITGYSRDEVVGLNPRLLQSGRQSRAFYQDMWLSLEKDGHWQGEIWNKRKNGDIYPQWLSINCVYKQDQSVHAYAGIFSDISERKQAEEQIRNLAYYDLLTGLPNRNLFLDRVSIALANARRHGQKVAVMFLDLDLFKRINDTLGHSAGDEVLRETAARLRHCVREGDTLARLGGDEFVVLLPELGQEQEVSRVAKRIVAAMEAPLNVQGQQLHLSVSIGISVFPDDGADVETLLKHADTAMYRVKEGGRNGFEWYSATMNVNALQRLSMENSLHRALSDNEFFLNYQVKVDLETGRIAGIEALLRWKDPQRGLITPAEFIPLAEQTGLIIQIGEWVLYEACRQTVEWQKMGLPPTRIAVNLSSLQFCKPGILDQVKGVLIETGLQPEYLELEVTESSIMQKVDKALNTLGAFHELGVQVAVDDFGTGFSSLSYLKDLPIDILKIDRSFLLNLDANHRNQAIVASIIELARRLDIRIVAEGVENAEQVRFLRAEGCHEIQGFLISRPLSADNIAGLFKQNLLPAAE